MSPSSLPLRIGVVVAMAGLDAAAQNPPAPEVPESLEPMLVHGSRAADPLDLASPAVTGSRLDIPVVDVLASVFRLDRAAFEARGLRTAQEAVDAIVGFTSAQSPGNGATFSARGFTGDDVSQLWDGIRLINPAMGARPLDTFNLQVVEVIKGPASVLHGEGAVGAVVNFISKVPNPERFEADVLASYGSWNTARLGVGVGGPVAETGLSFRADVSRASTDTFRRQSGEELLNVSAALRYDVSEDFRVTLHADALHDDFEAYFGVPLVNGQPDPRLTRSNFNVSDNVMKSETYWLRLRAEWTPSETVTLRNLTYGSLANRDWRNAEGYAFDPAAGTVTLRDLGIVEHEQNLVGNRFEAAFEKELGRFENRLAAGADVKRTDFFRLADFPSGAVAVDAFHPQRPSYLQASGAAGPSQRGADYEILQAAPFVEDQFAVLPDLKLVGGLRYDHIENEVFNRDNGATFSKSFDPVSYRAGVVWNATKEGAFYGQYSTSANSPRSFVNLGGAAFRGYGFSLEESRQFEFGYKQTAWDGRVEATLAYFNIEKDRIRTFRQGNERVGVEAGEQLAQGVEVEAVIRPVDGLSLGVNASVLSAELDHPGFADDGARPSNVPQQTAGGFISYRLPFGLEVGADYRYVGDRLGNDPSGPRFEMDDYALLGAYASYQWRNATLTVRGRNLSDERYLAWAEDDYGNQALVGAPASVEVELRLRF
ncbi:MAG: TonB-dependent receptor [Verrucomicrobiales bacterium]|nr:TonB-dependent receptor [Verrucomicrobiales bacterium]